MRPDLALLRTLAFLSRLPPVAVAFRGGPHPLGRDAPLFALAGAVIALPPALLLPLGVALGLSPLVAATLAVFSLVALTGALHEDGLGDTADGLFGHRPAADALRIMKDSRIGTYGALALTGSLMLRTALLAELCAVRPGAAALALLAAAAASRGWMAWLWSRLATADPGGLADRVGRPSVSAGLAGLVLGLAIAAALGLAVAGWPGLVLPALVSGLPVLWLARVLRRRLGGQTGDTLGAAQQLCEIALLLGFAFVL
ncbi:adenosylcobinamide-GDP ribazoletransferase [Aureimonas jatrophae]|uniref:Adenosylcobinamide-GDP ribazoletransferase n=1 Tax=Aureimonas jatrophae TaxID=1166073 RepID=A0A1H0D8J1_9HYPH|nr:adenosylcobinamide-GDP ribazoletransferase [Aureimonas jatrophae]MBB3951758.1 adenosylcobinamide-GDP ribazoletransferase [Aureimonas jatrophae]SDN66470.1 cobalamin-5'-phosphate synthase [Aureimonas jatrophae]